ncbi:hypothetical protein CES85_4916 [Ochrobactrum quorumnocens]|uniref:Uncharacterized protein n=1 Tax=Ochrobactrum quorumnocens TaxID=271865 RepID=A0A248UBQ5_9HYPH|nr:hypothetical protein CES85_4916 [[Ochrobactrum] quorumnocens]
MHHPVLKHIIDPLSMFVGIAPAAASPEYNVRKTKFSCT